MQIDLFNAGLFSVAALVLLGSPGPAIAALVAIGKDEGFSRGLRFYGGLQVGLALAAAVSALGLSSLITAFPVAAVAMTALATVYLIYLAYKIAASPVGVPDEEKETNLASTSLGGFLLGVSNPKAYVAFVSLMASYSIVQANASADGALKWLVCVVIMIVVDIIWLWIGAVIQKANLQPRGERILNVAMGATILLTTLLAFI